ncbi:hypothetical protein CDD82_6238 [Ophiocordyceps australis]|uniref:Uncharacterized protein n=1 Tax=Ophiocordyceps australis TaxID=1399860 RepID=A0A2C5YWQ5_9HYPO|nr:hypothetical protein CDD82_6238 [Ophiocordyceps australis]
MALKTACSGPVVGLHEACLAIQNGDACGAIVGSTNLILAPTMTCAMTQIGMLSPQGSCKAFDDAADGFARGEAINAIYIKSLDAALRDGNPIRAVIRATGSNSDGMTSAGMLHPNSASQAALIRHVYKASGLDPSQTAFVECHGTGTPAGDFAETAAVGSVFGKAGVYIGSVKPNVGHGEGASGLNGIIKAVLALEHRTFPPNIKFVTPSSKIPFQQLGLKVPTEPIPFPRDRAERVSVSSFGMGGSNAHVILDSYCDPHQGSRVNDDTGPSCALLLLSANTKLSLNGQIERYREFLLSNEELQLDNVAYTLATRREKLPHRGYLVVRDDIMIESSESSPVKKSAESPSTHLIFNGQGAQWPGMGVDLVEADPLFRADIEAMNKTLQGLKDAPRWNLLDELLKPAKDSKVLTSELSQPLCTALQVAVYNKLVRHGIKATAAVGHSSGEMAAAYAAGFISMDAAIVIAYYRGFITKHVGLDGAMAAVALSSKDVLRFLGTGVGIACENSPISTTLSGHRCELEHVVDRIKSELPETMARLLHVDVAYHSVHMETVAPMYMDLLGRAFKGLERPHHATGVTFVSSQSGEVLDGASHFGPQYWIDNLTSPVRFSTAVQSMVEAKGDGIFLEIGPHAALSGPLRQICQDASRPWNYIPAMIRKENNVETLWSALGKCFQHGVDVDWKSLWPGARAVSDLPTYSWDHSASFWYESRITRDWRQRKFPHHCLLGSRIPESPSTDPQWRNMLSLEDEPWLADHRIHQDIVFPMAGYISMAGEAARQMAGIDRVDDAGYSIQGILIHSALVLTNASHVEMVTTLHPRPLTDALDSEWLDFTISSCKGDKWTKHCQGQVKSLTQGRSSTAVVHELPRKMDSSRLYEAWNNVGLYLGPEFRRLESVTASTAEALASAHIIGPSKEQSKAFTMHPVVIDASIQLSILSTGKGLPRNISLTIPSYIEELDIMPGGQQFLARGWSSEAKRTLGVELVADGRTVLHASGIEYKSPTSEEETLAASRLEWFPDIDFVHVGPLLAPPVLNREHTTLLEEMALLCIIESSEMLHRLQPEQPHLAKLRQWSLHQVQAAETTSNTLVPDSASHLSLDSGQRRAMIDAHYQVLMGASNASLAQGVKRIFDNRESLFAGEAQAIDLLTEGGLLASIYNEISFNYEAFVNLMSVSKPTLRILEVGAGTGGTTWSILQSLGQASSLPRYSVYTFTDISAGFFLQAKERFSDAPNMEYKVFDISKDPVQQGFSSESYDLVIAANVVHATPCLKETLSHLNMLLKPGGTLLLTELDTQCRSLPYIFGNFSGWWLGDDDGRATGPFVSCARWNEELKASRFTGVEKAVYDDEIPYRALATYISTRTREPSSSFPENAVSLITSDPKGGVFNALSLTLQRAGFAVTSVEIGHALPQGQHAICCVDLEKNFFENIREFEFGEFQSFIKSMSVEQRILWLMSPFQMKCKDPNSALTMGVVRAIRAELGVPIHTLEVKTTEERFSELVVEVFRKVLREQDEENLEPDREFVVDSGVIYIGRYAPFSLPDETAQLSIAGQRTIKFLNMATLGRIDSIYWAERALTQDIPTDAVEIEPKYVGLIFRDILLAMNLIDSGRALNESLGHDLSGVVTAVGSNVKKFEVGDHVFALTAGGSLASRVIVPQNIVVKIPERLPLESAASIPVAFMTAIQSLVHIGRLKKGQSVLIHSACGGTGMASIQVCNMIGAEIFVTVGSPEKVDYLMGHFGIPRNRILHSRDESFVQGVMRETNNRGVDLVLNSLSGPLLHASWKCVAEFGIMVELGKRDLLGHGYLDLADFLGNRQYACFDALEYLKQRPEQVVSVLQEFLSAYAQDQLGPVPEITCFDAQDIVDAFSHLQDASHMGKVIVSMAALATEVKAKPLAKPIEFDPDATYLLTGGFGGLGRSLATWLVEHGAKSLVFLSRSAGISQESKSLMHELESMGCTSIPVLGAVDNMSHVKAAIEASGKPIKGVFHLAMAFHDSSLADMTWTQWDQAIKPKVQGAWNLHHALADQPLDFFWLASSIASTLHQFGPASYLAAIMFLEAFCQYRLGLGLPTTVLNICPIKGVGYVAENAAAQRTVKASGTASCAEKDYLAYVEHSILAAKAALAPDCTNVLPPHTTRAAWKNAAHVFMELRSEMHLDDPNNPINWRRDRRMGHYHNTERKRGNEQDTRGADPLAAFLNQASEKPELLTHEAECATLIAQHIGHKVLDLRLKPEDEVDVKQSLAQAGIDSLMAIELRRWFRQTVKVEASIFDITGSGSLLQLAKLVLERLKARLADTAC